ncbi:MAG: sulfatase-like hydrolase/transferase [Elusimicrobia bacterium]|nr:sulfatase-like hydrolase/transferase [Elusimicrobiota bacterium]
MENKKYLKIIIFVFFNLILTLLIGLPYFKFVGNNPAEIIYTIIAYLSNIFLVYILLLLLLSVFYFMRLPKIIFIFMFFTVNLLFFIDVGIYRIFRFHINGFVINTLFTKGGWESLDFNLATKLFFVFIIISLFLLEIFLYNYLAKSLVEKKYILRKNNIYLAVICVLSVIVADKGIYAYADLKNNPYITRHMKLFPLYQPLTIKKLAQKYFNLKIDETVSFQLDKEHSGLIYPKKKIEFYKNQQNLPNIIWILIDSFRYDMLNKDITPNIYEFSRKSLVFKDHYSGGNCTRFGVFSLFYGIDGYYWNSILGERQSPVFVDSLIKLNYDFKILAATELTFPEFTKTCFVEIPPEKIMDKPKSEDKSEKDAIIANDLIEYISKKESKTPFFSFIFFDCPHGSYESPSNFHKFKPAAETFNYITLNKDNILPVFNRYKNAIYYDDYLIGKILSELEKKNILKNTIVIISGDHGEAFFEKGFYGHNQGFCEEQVKVPFVLYIPNHKPQIYKKLTSHLDVVSTMFSFLGCKNSSNDYSQGFSLLENKEREYIVTTTWDEMAVINKSLSIVIPLESYNIPRIKMYDENYKEVLNSKLLNSQVDRLLKVQKEMTYFIK